MDGAAATVNSFLHRFQGVEEGLRNQMNHAAEALTWCRARLDAAHAKRVPRVGFGQEGWKESMKEPCEGFSSVCSGCPMAKHRALLRRLEHLQQSPKDPELRIPKVLQQERSPMRRRQAVCHGGCEATEKSFGDLFDGAEFAPESVNALHTLWKSEMVELIGVEQLVPEMFDTWADKSGDAAGLAPPHSLLDPAQEMHGFNARSLEVKKQAEMARVTPCSGELTGFHPVSFKQNASRAMAFAGPKIWPALLLAAAEEVLRPASVDCWDRPDWADFRQKAQGFARQGWPKADAELEAMSRALVEKWRWVVCKEDCRTTEHLTWFFVEDDWGAKCSESANFDRYLVTHYFRNRGLSYSARKSEYCHFGFITALVITAHFEFPNSVSKAGRLLFLAFVLLGDFLAFDWLSSSSWPVDSLMILLNVHMVSQELITGSQLEFVRAQGQLPGVRGAAFLREQSRWLGTSEAAKPVARGSFSRTLRIWQLDAHTALAGEAKTMLSRFGDEVEVQFLGNSLASNVCRNYDLCPSGEDKESFCRSCWIATTRPKSPSWWRSGASKKRWVTGSRGKPTC
ncbi:unnamed protein product [Effrenium voratum]|nr:unnamed protein product [Effrenium voratum]